MQLKIEQMLENSCVSAKLFLGQMFLQIKDKKQLEI